MIKNIYNFVLTIPDKLFLLPSNINGKNEYFLTSYNHTKDMCQRFGGGRHCLEILVWRELFHFLGALFFILVAVMGERWLKSSLSVFIVLGGVIAWITFQEFYLHPTFYNQTFIKGVIDWLVWVVPIVLYLLLRK